jgi:hypothetical protein
LVCESLRRWKQQAVIAELPQQSRYTLQHRGVVIDDKDDVSIWQNKVLGVPANADFAMD